MYHVYVLQSLKDNRYYYGYIKDLKRRLEQHNKGKVKATKSRVPFKLLHFENVETLKESLRKERYFKSGFGRKYIKK